MYCLMATSSIEIVRILQVARSLFLLRGPRVTTAEIARQAGVSEGIIFKRFATKQRLLLAAMDLSEETTWSMDLESKVGQGDPKETLIAVLDELMGFFRDVLPRIILIWSCRGEVASHLNVLLGPGSPRQRGLGSLVRYLEREMQLGRIAEADAEMVGRILVGSVSSVVFLESVGGCGIGECDSATQLAQVVDAIWRGMAPTDA